MADGSASAPAYTFHNDRNTGAFSAAADTLAFTTAGTERMRIDSSGRVGIGTTSVGALLHVSNGTTNNLANDTSEVRFIGSNKPLNLEQANLVIQTNDDMAADKGGSIGFGGRATSSSTNSNNFAHISGRKENSTSANFAGYLSFGTADSASDIHERVRIDSSGRVGIGTSSPDAPLTVHNSSDPEIRFGYSSTQDHKIAWDSSKVFIHADPENANGSSALGFAVDGTERARIDSSGNVLVGKTALDNSTAGVRLNAAGDVSFVADGNRPLVLNRKTSDGDIAVLLKDNTTVGSISVTGSATAYNTSSDARLKDVTGTARGLAVINELNPVAYNWKADGKADEGLIAQEVKELVPNAVVGSEADMYSMDYSKLVVHLVAGMQEQQKQMQEQQAIIEDLQTQLNKLKR